MSVRDLIAQLAHIEGGVHFARRRTRSRPCKRQTRTVFVGDLPAGVRLMRSIDRIVVRALGPLRDATETGTGGVI